MKQGEVRSIRVDFLGAPAAGKTTLLNALLSQSHVTGSGSDAHAAWISTTEAVNLAKRNAHHCSMLGVSRTSRVRSALRLLPHAISSIVRSEYHELPWRKLSERLKQELLMNFLQEHELFFTALVEKWFEPDMVLPPLPVRYDEMLRWTREWLFVNAWAGAVQIVGDNARFARAVAEMLSDTNQQRDANIEQAIKRYCLSSLGPAGLIHMQADPELVLQRIKMRSQQNNGALHPGHVNRSPSELLAYTAKRNKVNALSAAILEGWGIPVLTVSAAAPLSESVRQVRSFLSEISKRRESRSTSSLLQETDCGNLPS